VAATVQLLLEEVVFFSWKRLSFLARTSGREPNTGRDGGRAAMPTDV